LEVQYGCDFRWFLRRRFEVSCRDAGRLRLTGKDASKMNLSALLLSQPKPRRRRTGAVLKTAAEQKPLKRAAVLDGRHSLLRLCKRTHPLLFTFDLTAVWPGSGRRSLTYPDLAWLSACLARTHESGSQHGSAADSQAQHAVPAFQTQGLQQTGAAPELPPAACGTLNFVLWWDTLRASSPAISLLKGTRCSALAQHYGFGVSTRPGAN
jgi:hypothetical protein